MAQARPQSMDTGEISAVHGHWETRANLPAYERKRLALCTVLRSKKHLPEPPGIGWSWNLGHGEVPLLPSLDVCPCGASESSIPGLVLLDILFHMLPAPLQGGTVTHTKDLSASDGGVRDELGAGRVRH